MGRENYFKIENGILVSGRGCSGDVVIPDGVTSIGDSAFDNCTSLESVVIPNSVTSIGYCAFSYCTSLESVVIPNSVTSIDYCAFYGCENLKSIVITESVTGIGNYAFRGCKKLISANKIYKAFDLRNNKLVCRGYEFKLNEWSTVEKNIKLCEKGYHYCTNLFDVFNYYCGTLDEDIAIYECEAGELIIQSDYDNKCVTNKIKPIRRIYKDEVIKILNGSDK